MASKSLVQTIASRVISECRAREESLQVVPVMECETQYVGANQFGPRVARSAGEKRYRDSDGVCAHAEVSVFRS